MMENMMENMKRMMRTANNQVTQLINRSQRNLVQHLQQRAPCVRF